MGTRILLVMVNKDVHYLSEDSAQRLREIIIAGRRELFTFVDQKTNNTVMAYVPNISTIVKEKA